MSTEFNVTSEVIGNALILVTEGYINNVGGEKIVNEFTKHQDTGINKVVINLEKSKVVNSIGISYLIELIEKLTQNNGRMIFTNLDPTIEKTFKIMGLFQYSEKADSVDSALKSI